MSLELTELFGAKAGDHFYFGIIKRWNDIKKNPVVFSRIAIPENDWFVSQANDQRILSNMLNEICHMIVYEDIHADAGKVVDLQYPRHSSIPYSKEFNQYFLN